MLLIDQFAYQSKLRDKNPIWKAVMAAGLLVLTVSLRSFYFSLAVTVLMGFITVGAGRIPIKYYFRFLSIPLVFILLSVTAVIVNLSPQAFPGFCTRIGSIYIGISSAGAAKAAGLSMTAFGAVSCLYFLALSTPMTDILYVLTKMRCPALLLELMLLIYRFIFVLLEIAHALNTAQKSRLGNRNMKTGIRSMGALMTVLLFRSFRKSARLYDAMESRCYDGHIRVLYDKRAEDK